METNNTTEISPQPTTRCSGASLNYINVLEFDSCLVTTKFIINTVIAGLICIFGFVGNTVSLAVLKRDKRTPVASLLLQTLAVVDNCFLICWLVHFSVRDLLRYVGMKPYRNQIWEYTKTYTFPLPYIGQTATIWLTVFIAFTRYFAVCWPYSASYVCNIPAVRKGTISICVFAVLYNLPRFFEFSMTHKRICSQDFYLPDRTWLAENDLYKLIYSDILYYIFSFALPLLLLAGLNIRLVVAYRQVQKRRMALRGRGDRDTTAGENGHKDPNITLVMIIVVLIFMICNLPARVVQIIWAYDVPTRGCKFTYKFFIMEFSTLLEVLNSSTNFIVYCVFRHQFREILHTKLCNCTRAGQVPRGDVNGTQSLLNGVTCKTVDTNCQVTQL